MIGDLIRIDSLRYNTTWSACERQMYEFYDLGPYNWTRNLTYDQICLLTEDEAACSREECGVEFEVLFISFFLFLFHFSFSCFFFQNISSFLSLGTL